jgi:hypothetical protein
MAIHEGLGNLAGPLRGELCFVVPDATDTPSQVIEMINV